MRIVRFEDETGAVRFGQDMGNGTATVLEGGLFALDPIDRQARIVRLLAPVESPNIYCIGLNYREHAAEGGQDLPETPVIFMKPTTALNHPGDPIVLPGCCKHGPEVDFECELAVIIGTTGRDIPQDRALGHVCGYTCANDVSARRWQKQGGAGQWVRGKSFDTFCPLGPALVTADELTDPQTLSIKTTVNGQVMQDSNTADMIFSVAELIAFVSQDTTLLPGTVILTGTPQGVGFARKPPSWLADGDEVVIEIEKIGKLVNPIVASP